MWSCGYTLPVRDMEVSYSADDYGITADFVLKQTIWPPNALVIEVLDIDTQMGRYKRPLLLNSWSSLGLALWTHNRPTPRRPLAGH